MSMILDGSLGVTFNDASLQGAAASPYGLKNKIINGAMVISQRGTSFSYNNNNAYCLDRFYVRYGSNGGVAGTATVTQSSTSPSGFTNSLLLTVGTARTVVSGDRFGVEQQIEGFNTADFGWGTASAKPVTLSFWVRSSVTGTFGLCFSNFSRGYAATYTISVADTWEQKSVTIAGDTSGTWSTTNTVGVLISFDLGMGSDVRTTTGSWQAGTFLGATGATNLVSTAGATFYITGVQLEQNTSATPFERRLFNQELANCQRYFQLNGAGAGTSLTTTAVAGIAISFAVAMRASPTLTVISGTSALVDPGIAFRNISSVTISGNSTNGCYIDCTSTTTTINKLHTLLPSVVSFSAEL